MSIILDQTKPFEQVTCNTLFFEVVLIEEVVMI